MQAVIPFEIGIMADKFLIQRTKNKDLRGLVRC
jgi:hypothetical protein